MESKAGRVTSQLIKELCDHRTTKALRGKREKKGKLKNFERLSWQNILFTKSLPQDRKQQRSDLENGSPGLSNLTCLSGQSTIFHLGNTESVYAWPVVHH